MTQDEDGKVTKIAHTMMAKDGEVTWKKFVVTLFPAGAVHQWVPLHRPGGDVAEQTYGFHEGDYKVKEKNIYNKNTYGDLTPVLT